MIYEVDECVSCGLPCMGDYCQLRHVKYFRCDECGADELDEDEMYDEDICLSCAREQGLLDDEEEE